MGIIGPFSKSVRYVIDRLPSCSRNIGVIASGANDVLQSVRSGASDDGLGRYDVVTDEVEEDSKE
jgi:hypothetical protein